MSKFQRTTIYLSVFIAILFVLYKYLLTSGLIKHSSFTDLIEVFYYVITSFITFILFNDLIQKNKRHEQETLTQKKLNEVLLNQSYNPNYYSGNVNQPPL